MATSNESIGMTFFNPAAVTKAVSVLIAALLISPGLFAAENKSSSMGNVVLPELTTPKNILRCS